MKERFKKHKCCIILFSRSGGKELLRLVDSLLAHTEDIVLFGNANQLDVLQKAKIDKQLRFITLQKHPYYWQKLSFDYARNYGYEYALWLEDIQSLQPATLSLFLDELDENPGTLLVGDCSQSAALELKNAPFYHRCSHVSFSFKTGLQLNALTSAYRLYPIREMSDIRYASRGAGFEREALVKAAWKNIAIKNIPIEEEPQQVTPQKLSFSASLRRFSQLSLLNTYLVSLALFYYAPLRLFKIISKENIQAFINKNFFDRSEPIHTKALSIAFGVFMALSPFIGLQLLLGIPLAHFMKLNKALFVTAANINIPPVIPFLMWGSFKLGAVFVEQAKSDLFLSQEITLEALKENFLQYGIGALILATVSALVSGLIAYTWLSIARNRRIALETAPH